MRTKKVYLSLGQAGVCADALIPFILIMHFLLKAVLYLIEKILNVNKFEFINQDFMILRLLYL